MKSTELRVGNLVNWGVNVCEIKGIHTQSIGQTENRDHHFYVNVLNNKNMNYYCFMPNEIEPIELTPQWFYRFGFMFEYGYHEKDKFRVFYNKKKDVCELRFDVQFNITEIKHVHQLQNLFFALTQTELTLKSQ